VRDAGTISSAVPEDPGRLIVELLNACDVDGVVELYEPARCLRSLVEGLPMATRRSDGPEQRRLDTEHLTALANLLRRQLPIPDAPSTNGPDAAH
jgi:hypothetical protein